MEAAETMGDIYRTVAAYYTRTVEKYGATPRGVDWRCAASQELRFVQLLKVCDFTRPFSLNDVGCGYGALVSYLAWRHSGSEIDYLGIDGSAAMVRRARRRHGRDAARFALGWVSPRVTDYSVASGIFNVKLEHSLESWERHVASTLAAMNETSRRAFAVNFMGPEGISHGAEGLYRTTPQPWIRHCEREFGGRVEVLLNYGLREFTLLIRKAGAVN